MNIKLGTQLNVALETPEEIRKVFDVTEGLENRFKEKGVFFYKPFEYGYGAYGDKYLEDGIIEFEGTNKKIVIEVYGRNDEDYLERKDIKSQMLSGKDNIYIYIPWEAYNNEPLPYKRICAEIEGVLNEVNSQWLFKESKKKIMEDKHE